MTDLHDVPVAILVAGVRNHAGARRDDPAARWADEIHAAAIEEGMVPLTQAAVNLARQGLISLTEAWRVRAD